ncbi:unnamed protein product [Allacma fusca]|uniref:tRNA-dihydrouridine synthase n=1 Tax=Allacma fusca TaxID=39272 RepID=A0A8J2NV11_9HEXA|nr:unnamed protein product [Allacma fusca]
MMDLFETKPLVKICAPMVRYSRLPFRQLVREYGCDLAFSPMIMADSFVKSQKYRDIEFTTHPNDNPLIVQFAAKTPEEFAEAAEYIYNDSSGIDLNCGCPQRWAIQDGIGACMLNKPEVVADILRQTRNRIPDVEYSVSVKIRIFRDLERTVDLVRQLESAGISFLSVHGRTIKERSEPVNWDTIRTIVDSVSIPVIANGDINSLEKAYAVQEATRVKGVMVARALLENPGLFAGHSKTPASCLKRWLEINVELGTHFTIFHRHLIHMTESILTKSERKIFNGLNNREAVIDWLCDRFEFQLSQCTRLENNTVLDDSTGVPLM